MNKISLRTKYLGRNLFEYEKIDSTQKETWRRVENGNIQNGSLILTKSQTDGIGTHGRTWYTSRKNITFSFVLFPNCKIEKLENFTYEIAELIVKVFKDLYKLNLEIKIPNDLIINGKKVGGILTETKLQNGLVKSLVIGIGINTNNLDFPKELKTKATSIKKEFNIQIDNFKFIIAFCNEFEDYFEQKSGIWAKN